MERSYQNLALQLDKLDEHLDLYFSQNPNIKLRDKNSSTSQHKIQFGQVGEVDSTVVLHVKTNGFTTIQYKLGKNQELGKTLADHLYETIDQEGNKQINLSLKGFDEESVSQLINEMTSTVDDEGNKEFEITTSERTNSNKYVIRSLRFNDRLVVTHHTTTNCLQVQGAPLFCYKVLVYSLTALFNSEVLFSVLSCTTDDRAILFSREDSQRHVENLYANSYPRMQQLCQDLLISSYCVKLANPKLTDYSMLLFGDLRALEGVIKQTLSAHGLHTDSERHDIGHYYKKDAFGEWKLDSSYQGQFSNATTISCLGSCYTLFNRQRHALFHMSDIPYTSRIITDMDEVTNLSEDISHEIESLYIACDKL